MDILENLNGVKSLAQETKRKAQSVQSAYKGITNKDVVSYLASQGLPLNFKMLGLGVASKYSPEQLRAGFILDEKILNDKQKDALRKLYQYSYHNPYNQGKDLQYDIYPNVRKNKAFIDINTGKGNDWEQMITRTAKDPFYDINTAIGRARFRVDNDGNILLIDAYDFPNYDKVTDKSDFTDIHRFGEKHTGSYPIRFNLGKYDPYKNMWY